MSTRSNIIVKVRNNLWRRTYCHYDGYIDHNGRRLNDHYATPDRAVALSELGDLSSLDESLEKPDGHTFDNRVRGYSVFYGRDRGETDVGGVTGRSLKSLWPFNEMSIEYVYVWNGEHWLVGRPDWKIDQLHRLSDVLKRLDERLASKRQYEDDLPLTLAEAA